MSDLEEQLKELEKERQAIEAKKKALQEKIEEEAAADQKLDKLFEKSGYPTPRALIIALMRKYNVRISGAPTEGRRKRTKVTGKLRDDVREAVNGGLSKNQASKKFGISYLVVNKIMAGKYDDL